MKLLVSLLGLGLSLILSVFLSIVTMIYGYGVQPKSWAVIIGVGFFAQFAAMVFAHVFSEFGKSKPEPLD